MKSATLKRLVQTMAFVLGLVTVAGVVALGGCEKSNTNREATSAPVSQIRTSTSNETLTVDTPKGHFELHPDGSLRTSLAGSNGQLTLDDRNSTRPLTIVSEGKALSPAQFDLTQAQISEATGKLGPLGKTVRVSGTILESGVSETLTLEAYDNFPEVVLLSVAIKNEGSKDLRLDTVSMQEHNFIRAENAESAGLWTFQGSSLKWGKDEIFPMPAKFEQENPFGVQIETKGDLGRVGGGIPVVAFWNGQVGEAIGHIETLPLAVSIPVQTANDGHLVHAAVRLNPRTVLKPGEAFSTPRTFLAIFPGDFYQPLALWSNMLDAEGLKKPANNEENYAISWCGWGYEFAVTPKQMLDTIPKLKELGIHWATLDDGWFNNYGDWGPRQPTFTVDSIREMNRQFHEKGIKVQVWWLPLAVEDGHFGYGGRKFVVSDVVKQHPDWLILDKAGKPARMTRNLATLCPALPEVQSYYKEVTQRFIKDWDFDGHKLDNIYSTPLCFNPKHHHKSPMDSVYAMGEVYKMIFETTRALKPDSVTQSCPCGTPPSLAWLRFMDQAVTADPVGSVQVRRRMKMYKALLGANAAVYGDHVELTRITNTFTNEEQDLGQDFASTLGTGGVLGTKFTWPDYGPKFKNEYLTSQKEEHWKQWIDLYNQKMLSKGQFLDLYVYGYDRPEGYAIEKDGHIYYAFYEPSYSKITGDSAAWDGSIELRGLSAGQKYHVADYVHHQDLGTVTGPAAKLNAKFQDFLLLEAVPESR